MEDPILAFFAIAAATIWLSTAGILLFALYDTRKNKNTVDSKK